LPLQGPARPGAPPPCGLQVHGDTINFVDEARLSLSSPGRASDSAPWDPGDKSYGTGRSSRSPSASRPAGRPRRALPRCGLRWRARANIVAKRSIICGLGAGCLPERMLAAVGPSLAPAAQVHKLPGRDRPTCGGSRSARNTSIFGRLLVASSLRPESGMKTSRSSEGARFVKAPIFFPTGPSARPGAWRR